MQKPARLLAVVAGFISSFAAHADVCVSSTCGYLEKINYVGDAENLFFTDVGDLFVSGGRNVYAIVGCEWGPPDCHTTWSMSRTEANFTGMAQIGSTLYATSFDGRLWALDLTHAPLTELVPIYQITGVGAANGLVAGPSGELYLVNGPVSTSTLPDPKIVRLKLDATDPRHVIEQTTWFSGDQLMFPNGLTRKGNTLYLTDHNSAKLAVGWIAGIDILANGSAGPLRQIAHFPSIPDDLSLYGDDFLVAEYSTGTVARFGSDGKFISQLRPESVPGASSVKVSRAPYGGDLLITRKGVVGLDENQDGIYILRRRK